MENKLFQGFIPTGFALEDPGPLSQYNKGRHTSVLQLGKDPLFTDIWAHKDPFFFQNGKFLTRNLPLFWENADFDL